MPEDRAFVVMQVGNEGSPERKRADEVYNFLIKPTIEEFGLAPYRADLDPSPGAVTPTMLRQLLEARLIVADLTGRNPNVFYELGISHSFARPLICIADSASHLPFDAKDERVIQLGDYPETGLTYVQGERAKASLTQTLEVVLADGYVPPSPLQSVGAGRSLDQLAPSDPVAAELGEMRALLESIESKMMGTRLAVPPAAVADMLAMRSLIASIAEAVPFAALSDLKAEETSKGHREWVDRLLKNRDPWDTPTAASDEVPF